MCVDNNYSVDDIMIICYYHTESVGLFIIYMNLSLRLMLS